MPLTVIQITGDDTHDSIDQDRGPIKIGGKAASVTPTAVSAGDRVNAYFDTQGYQHVKVDGTVTVSGGGTAYTEGDVDASFTGNIALAEGTADTARPIQVFELGGNYALKAAIVDGSGTQITSFGGTGGVQYTEGDTDSTITGTAILWEDTSDTLRAVSAAKPLPVGDAGGSLTIDNTVLSVVGGGTEATAQRVTIASDSTGVLSVDDNGGSLTVDGTVSITGAVDTELTTADLDTGAGTDTRAVVGMVLAASGGGLLVGTANPMPVSDNSGSLTIDNPVLSVVGGGTEATAQRVTIASDSTGVLSVDDNGGSITVDGTVAVSGTVAVTQSTSPWVTADNQTIADNAGFTDGTSKVLAAGFIFDESAGTALTENDAAAARIDSKRAQVLVIEDETTRGRRTTVTAANALKVDGSAVTQPVSIAATVTVDTELPAAAALADNTANPTVPGVGSFMMAWDAASANWDRVIVGPPSSDNNTAANFPGVLCASTLFAFDGTNFDRVRLEASILGLMVGGSKGDDVAEGGNPVSMGLTARQTNRTAATDGNRVRAIADDIGRAVTCIGQVRDLVTQSTTLVTAASTTSLLAAAASTFHDLTSLDMINFSQFSVKVSIIDNSTTVAVYPLAPKQALLKSFTRPWKQTTVNTAWLAHMDTAASVYINLQAEKNV